MICVKKKSAKALFFIIITIIVIKNLQKTDKQD